MKPNFREDKTTQAASLLLQLRGGKMSYMKLVKLLYLIDREALIQWGRPITFDSYVSMDNGPVLSNTLNLITEGVQPGQESSWSETISPPKDYSVELLGPQESEDLSDAEISLITDVFEKFGHLNRWKLVEIVHQLAEWKDPHGSAIPIDYSDILKAGGKTDIETATILEEIESLALADHFFV